MDISHEATCSLEKVIANRNCLWEIEAQTASMAIWNSKGKQRVNHYKHMTILVTQGWQYISEVPQVNLDSLE